MINGIKWTAIAAVVAAVGCAQDGADGDTAEKQSNLYLHGNTWPNGVVDVCYDGNDGNNPTLLAEAQRQLTYSWKQAANISFNGWGQCNYSGTFSPRSFVALHFVPGTRGNASTIGRTIPLKWSDYCGPGVSCYPPGVTHLQLRSDDPDPFQQQFRYQVIHEFGHALGFDHEQERPDNFDRPPRTWPPFVYCGQFDNGQRSDPGGTYLTSYFDVPSIMDYCSSDPLIANWVTKLSGGDIYGSRQVYGRRTFAHGFMISPDAWGAISVKAEGGAAPGVALKLSDACTEDDPDCTWTSQYGMLVSDKDPSLAITVGSAVEGTPLTLSRSCVPSNPMCTWTYKAGEFRLDADPGLAMNAWNGSWDGNDVKLHGSCTPANGDCTWHLNQVMLSSARNTTLAINAYGGGANGVDLKLINFCTVDDINCTWRFSGGMITASWDPHLAIRPYIPTMGPPGPSPIVELSTSCTPSEPTCRWTWSKGQLINEGGLPFPINAVNGATHMGQLRLNGSCTAQNPDCVFQSFWARY